MYKLLWLDDLRNPNEYRNIIEYLAFEYLEVEIPEIEVVWVKTQREFENYINENGLPDIISFDNDLGIGNGEGYSCAKWLVDYCETECKELPYYYVHSANPVAKEYIKGLLQNYEQYTKSC